MKTVMAYICIFILACISPAMSAPSISTTVVDGPSITISGLGFGSKPTAAPIKFDTFEDGVVGADVTSTSYWEKQGTNTIVYDDAVQRVAASNNIKSVHTDTSSAWFRRTSVGFATTGKCYVNFWARIDAISGDDSWQHKLWRLNSTGEHTSRPAVINQLWFNTTEPVATSQNYYEVYASSGTNLGTETNTTQLAENYWVNISVAWKASTIDTADGDLTVWVSKPGTYQVLTKTNFISKSMGFESDIDAINLGYLIENGGTSVVTYFDDVYMDNSWARVEIGDNAVYVNCTHREIQPSVTWSDTGITGTLNIGSFAPDATVYFFVVDSDGVASAGYEVDLTGTPVYDTPTITAPEDFNTTSSSVEIEGPYTVDPDLADQSVIVTWTLGEDSGFAVAALGVFSCTVPDLVLGANSIVFEITDSNSGTGSDTTVVMRTAPPISSTSTIHGYGVLKNITIH